MAPQEISQIIGSVEAFGFLLEDGVNVPEQNILLGGNRDEETGEIDTPHYLVTSAWQDGSSVYVNATLIAE